MKRILSMLLVFATCLSFAACGVNHADEAKQPHPQDQTATGEEDGTRNTTAPTTNDQPGVSEEITSTEGNFVYTILENALGDGKDCVKIVKYTGTEVSVSIPYRINGKDVILIGEGAFKGCTSLEEVEMGDCSIGPSAFENCTSIKRVKFTGRAMEFIDDNAFKGCTSLEEVYTSMSGVKTIGSSAFENCTSLKSFTTLIETETVKESAFRGCTSLESVSFGFANKSIGNYAFYGCTSLKKVTISPTTKSVGNYAFYGCTSLEEATIYDNSGFGTDVFGNCPNLKK